MKKLFAPLVRWILRWVPPGCIRIMPNRVLAAYLAALAFYPKDFEVLTKSGLIMRGNTRDVIQRHICVFKEWEPNVSAWLAAKLRPGDVAVDIGANIGYDTLLASKLVGEAGTVVSFEPVDAFCRHLEEHVSLNGLSNVSLHRFILSDVVGQMEIFKAEPDNLGNSSVIPGASRHSAGLVECRPLDEVLSESEARATRVLKIDTEGSEVEVLRGARRTLGLLRTGASVIVEVTPELLALRGYDASDVWEHFPAALWEAWDLKNEYDVAAYRGRPSTPVPLSEFPGGRLDVAFVKR